MTIQETTNPLSLFLSVLFSISLFSILLSPGLLVPKWAMQKHRVHELKTWDVTPRLLPVLMVTFRRKIQKWLNCLMAISCAQRQLGKVNTAWPGTQYAWACEINGFSPMQRQYLICSSPILLNTIYRLIVPAHADPSLGVFPGKVTLHMFAGWYALLHMELQACVSRMSKCVDLCGLV